MKDTKDKKCDSTLQLLNGLIVSCHKQHGHDMEEHNHHIKELGTLCMDDLGHEWWSDRNWDARADHIR